MGNVEYSQTGTCFMNEFFLEVTVCNGASEKQACDYAVEKGQADSHMKDDVDSFPLLIDSNFGELQ
jgi:hypothetical protein